MTRRSYADATRDEKLRSTRCGILAAVGYAIFRQRELEWVPRGGGDDSRTVARLSGSMTQ